jgi:excisionase family DNA binding protein
MRLTYTVAEAAAAAGISESHAYRLIKRGEFPARRLGNRLVVPKVMLDRFLAGEAA